ncbi:MAG: PilZ domain-containing protein [Magnetococcales bacterium]|nr:PilZ domain-containing protein [Magnetococcales bacterium]
MQAPPPKKPLPSPGPTPQAGKARSDSVPQQENNSKRTAPPINQPAPAASTQAGKKIAVQRDDRIPFNTKLRFESDDGVYTIEGATSDVSMSGAFLNSETLPPSLKEGMEGVVFLEMSKEGNTFEVSFHCTIARVTPRGIGLNFESEVE